MKKKILRMFQAAALGVAVIVASQGAPAPALADYTFNAPSGFMSLFPDQCIPTGLSDYCITFTNATYTNGIAQTQVLSQVGQMGSLNLQSLTWGQVQGDVGSDPTKSQRSAQTCAAGGTSSSAPADATASDVTTNAAVDQAALDTIAQAAIADAAGETSASQWQMLVELQHEATQNQQLCLAAAQEQQQAQQAREAINYAASAFDATNAQDPTSGWTP